MSLPELWTVSLLLIAPLIPILNAVLLSNPGWRAAAVRWSPVSALPALLLALTGISGTVLDPPWPVKLATLGLDETGRIFLIFSAVLWLLSGWFSLGYLSDDRHPTRFHIFFLLSMAGNFILILARDIPTFYSGFALMGFASCGLVAHKGDPAAVRAGRIYLALAAIGEIMLFSAFGMLATQAETVEIARVVTADMPRLPFLLLFAGFGIKAGALSLHFWLPLAHSAAPVPASAVLSGAMIKAGLFGWLRFLPFGLVALPNFGIGLITAGLAATLLATIAGVTQRNPKTVLAYSSLGQMGIIIVGLGVAFLRPAAWPGLMAAILIYALHHALAKGALFLGVTPAMEAATRRQIWLARFGLLVSALALAGAPFTSGALAKLALKAKLDYLPEPWGYLVGFSLTLAAMGTAMLMARFLFLVWPRPSRPPDGMRHPVWVPWTLAVVGVTGGFWLYPGATTEFISTATPAKVWSSFWPVLAGVGLALIVSRTLRRFHLKTPKGIPAGDIIVPLERIVALVRSGFSSSSSDASRSGGKRPRDSRHIVQRLLALEDRLRDFGTGSAILLGVIVVLFLILG